MSGVWARTSLVKAGRERCDLLDCTRTNSLGNHSAISLKAPHVEQRQARTRTVGGGRGHPWRSSLALPRRWLLSSARRPAGRDG